jgi:hypothetical protein
MQAGRILTAVMQTCFYPRLKQKQPLALPSMQVDSLTRESGLLAAYRACPATCKALQQFLIGTLAGKDQTAAVKTMAMRVAARKQPGRVKTASLNSKVGSQPRRELK